MLCEKVSLLQMYKINEHVTTGTWFMRCDALSWLDVEGPAPPLILQMSRGRQLG